MLQHVQINIRKLTAYMFAAFTLSSGALADAKILTKEWLDSAPLEMLGEKIAKNVEDRERTGTLFTGARKLPLFGDAEGILDRIEEVVDERWCHHASYEYQSEQLRKVLRKMDLIRDISDKSKDGDNRLSKS